MLVGLIVIVEGYIGEISGLLMVGIKNCYAQQEMLMKEYSVGVAGICQWRKISAAPK